MADIKIVVDTSADMPEELREKYDIGLISFMSVFGEESYVAGVELSNEEFYKKLTESDKIPTTAQTPFGDMYDSLLELAKAHKTVIYFTISSKASGQFQTANLVREEIMEEYPEADIRLVDTKTFSLYIASAAVLAAELVKEGKNADEIIEKCKQHMDSWKCFLLVDTLKYLEKGGRINKATAIVGTMLDIKPILTVEDGLVGSMDKLRGKKKLIDKLIEKIEEDSDFDSENPKFMVVQSDDEKGQSVLEKLKEKFGDDCIDMYSEFGPIVGTHVGPGAFGIIAKTKS